MNSWIKRSIKQIEESQTSKGTSDKEFPVFIEAYLKEMETDPDFTREFRMNRPFQRIPIKWKLSSS